MCGLVGFTYPKNGEKSYLDAMLNKISYRGPDKTNIIINSNIALGHKRLIIIDPNGGNQPCINNKNGNLMIYNGELYGYQKLGIKLLNIGIKVNIKSDTEILFCLLNNFGIKKTLSMIDGMFAFVFYDATNKITYLARDKLGEKPLYYIEFAGRIFFASEIKSFFAHKDLQNLLIDQTSIAKYLFFDYIPNPKTLFKNIYKVSPGEIITFKNHKIINKEFFFRPYKSEKNLQKNEQTTKQIISNIEKSLESSIKDRLVADVPVGILLSGGLDSSLIAAIASKYDPNIQAITARFKHSTYDETKFATAVTKQYKLQHHIFEFDNNQFLLGLDSIINYIDEPLGDPSIIPTYLICKNAKKSVSVALTGDGCDELFAGYINFKAAKFSSFLTKLEHKDISTKFIKFLISKIPISTKYMSLSFLISQYFQAIGQNNILQSYYWMSSFCNDDLSNILSFKFNEKKIFNEIFQLNKELDSNNVSKSFDKLQTQFLSFYLPDDILTKSDRASMYNSIELRSPFLSNDFVNNSLIINQKLKLKGLNSKYALRQIAENYFKKDFIYRKKHGFTPPIADLLKNILHNKVEETLRDRNNFFSDLFNHNQIENILYEHKNNKKDHRKKIWSIFVLFALGNKFKDYYKK